MQESKIIAIRKHGDKSKEFSKDLENVKLHCAECGQKCTGCFFEDDTYPHFVVLAKDYKDPKYLLKCTCCECEFYIMVEEN